MKQQLIIASAALTVLTGCWGPSTKWDEAKQRASCESAYPGEPDKAKDCYNTAKLIFDRETAKTMEGAKR
jgi:hypothetical protein